MRRLSPDFGQAYYVRGNSRYLLAENSESYLIAKIDLDKAIELASDESWITNAYMVRGAVLYVLEDNQAAILDLDKDIELDEDNAHTYNARAIP